MKDEKDGKAVRLSSLEKGHDRLAARTDSLERKMRLVGIYLVISGTLTMASGVVMLAITAGYTPYLMSGILTLVMGFITLTIGVNVRQADWAPTSLSPPEPAAMQDVQVSSKPEANKLYNLARVHSRDAWDDANEAALAAKYLADAIALDPTIKGIAEKDETMSQLL